MFKDLNKQQQEVVKKSIDKNTVVVAGAGSGKTRVLVERVQYLLESGKSSTDEIMVVTFTNKASNELKERLGTVKINNVPITNVKNMWVGTFHSICVRIINMFGYLYGINNFTIIDDDQKKKVIKELMKKHILDLTYLYDDGWQNRGKKVSNKLMKKMINKISSLKNNFVSSLQFYDNNCNVKLEDNKFIYYLCRIYKDYCNYNFNSKCFDFDDLLVYGCMLSQKAEVKQYFRDKIKWFNIDEAQDTNKVQYSIILNLAGTNNIFLVGDDSQSIYSFRSAKPEYLLNFKKNFPNGQILSLDQNYRSTKTLVEASNYLINNNTKMYKKKCFSENEDGAKISIIRCGNEMDEASYVINSIMYMHNNGGVPFKDFAILYRTNKQSRVIEEELVHNNVPHKLVGCSGFYTRKVIKDVLSFIKFYANRMDDDSFSRSILLLPSIGKSSVNKTISYSQTNGYDLLTGADNCIKGKAKNSLTIYNDIINSLNGITTHECIEEVYKSIKPFYSFESNAQEQEYDDLIDELIKSCKEFEFNNPNSTLQDYINNVMLLSSTNDNIDGDNVSVMTMHASKGLEFKVVFIVGCQEDFVPHKQSIDEDNLEEERRLLYVGVTRAEKKLVITYYGQRSRFLEEIPDEYLDKQE